MKVREIAKNHSLHEKGRRLVVNDDGGQTVNHLHIHILGDRKRKFFSKSY